MLNQFVWSATESLTTCLLASITRRAMWYAPDSLIRNAYQVRLLLLAVDYRRLAGVRCIQIRQPTPRRCCCVTCRPNRYPLVLLSEENMLIGGTNNSGERRHQRVFWSAPARSALPSAIRALADWHHQGQGTTDKATRVGRQLPSSICRAVVAHSWLLQPILQ